MRFRLAFSAIVMAAILPFAIPQPAHAADPSRTRDLAGLDVTGLRGEELGQIAAVSDTPDGRDATVLVEASGMLDVGHRFFTLHLSQLQPGEAEDTVTAKATAEDVLKLIRDDTQVAER